METRGQPCARQQQAKNVVLGVAQRRFVQVMQGKKLAEEEPANILPRNVRIGACHKAVAMVVVKLAPPVFACGIRARLPV